MGASSRTNSGHRGARPSARRVSRRRRVGEFSCDLDVALRAGGLSDTGGPQRDPGTEQRRPGLSRSAQPPRMPVDGSAVGTLTHDVSTAVRLGWPAGDRELLVLLPGPMDLENQLLRIVERAPNGGWQTREPTGVR